VRAILLARFVVDSRFGKILIAVRDTESRTRFWVIVRNPISWWLGFGPR